MESVQQLRDAAVKPDDVVLYECLCDSTVSRSDATNGDMLQFSKDDLSSSEIALL